MKSTRCFSSVRDGYPRRSRRPPGSDPLNGASFFVDGPRHGSAAGTIAKLLRIDPTRYRDAYSWARFRKALDYGRLHRRFAGNRALRWRVQMLEKIADEPEVQRF